MAKRPSPDKDNLYQYPFLKKINGTDVLFIHIPRTGGSSIAKALQLNPPNREIGIRKHYTTSNILQSMDESFWADSFSFCFVRNPWDRLVSQYNFRKKQKVFNRPQHYFSFKSWVNYELNQKKPGPNLRPQLDWITNEHGAIAVKEIGRFENLQEDFARISYTIDSNYQWTLPHINDTKYSKSDYRAQFDEKTATIVAKFYQKDIDQFGYTF